MHSSLHSGQHVNSILGQARKLHMVLPHILATLSQVLKLRITGRLSLDRQNMIHEMCRTHSKFCGPQKNCAVRGKMCVTALWNFGEIVV